MLFFEHYGRDPNDENRFRRVFMTLLFAVEAVVLLPFTLLSLFLWALGMLREPQDLTSRAASARRA